MTPNVIKVFGGEPPCAKCKNVEKVIKEAINELNLDAEVVHVSALSAEADKYDIMITPSVVVNEKVVARGKALSKNEFKTILERELKAK
jgi:small redox-active disulfide protein 2